MTYLIIAIAFYFLGLGFVLIDGTPSHWTFGAAFVAWSMGAFFVGVHTGVTAWKDDER